ncbi:peptidase domain-containing ABC transporter [Hoylesella timonensis]|uniref:ABC transporter ATP-binding protein n=1 Tax=Hoylesella timonensis S9-PR14 TaxID=1401062 RepID=A0A098YQ85_9BACT|nr:peptidase domain-containing ABC transporter [Hoylesella timonensis]KGI21427.1 ABC transporter ATP-binding protein [Hoylesella timonensis S9-PR14]
MLKKTFPHYTQLNSSDCGPTCLRMIASFYGKEYSQETIRRHCFISREGVSLLGICDAAEYIGMHCLGMKLTIDQLVDEVNFPCILHWNQNHFVVCYDVKRSRIGEKYKFYIADPASQCITYNEEEFKKGWISSKFKGEECGVALLLEPDVDFGKNEDDCYTPEKKRNFRTFAHYYLQHKRLLLQIIAGMLVGIGMQFIFPFLTQAMVDVGIGHKNFNIVTLILIAQIILFIAQLSVDFIRSWVLLHINARVDITLISSFLYKLTCMPLNFFDTRKLGDTLQRVGDHARIKSFLMGNSLNIIFSFVSLIIFSCVLAYYSIMIFSIFMVGNILNLLWITIFMKYRRELDSKRFGLSSTEQNRLVQLIQGMQDIKLNNCEREKRWEWEHLQIGLFRISSKGLTITQIQQTGSSFLSQATNFIILYLSATAVIHDNMTLGMMMSVSYIIGQLSAPFADFVNFAYALQDARISMERLNDIYEQEDEEDDIDKNMTILPTDHNIRIENMYFSYSGNSRNYTLQDINLTIEAGKVTAIVGSSGSGKTTLIKILQGFYKPNQGSVCIGNVPLELINPHVWRASTGSVMQDSFLFSDSIAKNIALSTEQIDIKRLQLASKMANVDSFISTMPLGYNTRIGMEGIGVSQGQRQRILIARAIYKNPEFIFFDEATNALDATNEWEIMNALHSFYKGKTVVIAAHRLSTISQADQIVVIKEGKIVEVGSHEQLLEKKGEYYELVNYQM